MTILFAASAADGGGLGAAVPTCSDILDIEVHGQHVVGDYVTGIGRDTLAWPPKKGVVGTTNSDGGAVLPSGPGPRFHFPNGVAPGASLCTQSRSPGAHF